MIIDLVFDCPFKEECFRHQSKKFCEEKMQAPIVIEDGAWIGAQLFCDEKPKRTHVCKAIFKFGLGNLIRKVKEKPKEDERRREK